MINSEWDILDLYFKDHKYPFTGHHLDSYRYFVKTQIPYIIKSYNPITMIKYDDNENIIMKVDVYIGGENGDEIFVDRPITYENGTPKLITPNDARMRNLTYETHLFAKVFIKITTNENGKIYNKTFNNVAIGSIPIMLHSDICVLKNQGSNVLRQLGECPYDTGGYFIIDGKEKVIIAQEKIVTNKLFVSKITDDDDGFSYKGVIRCVADKGALAPRSVEFYYVDRPIIDAFGNDDIDIKYLTAKKYIYGSIYVTLPSFNGKIPLFILFRAFGIESDKDIFNIIFGNKLDENDLHFFEDFIRPSILSNSYVDNDNVEYNIYSQEDALKYLKNKVRYGTFEHVKSTLTMDVFPNINDFYSKGKYLGYLVLQFIKTVINVNPISDRDSYIYKRVDISGFMLSELFQEAYEKLRDSIRNTMDSMYYYGSWKQQDNYDNFINDNNIYKLVSPMIVTDTFGKSLKGRWGLASSEDPELGKVQDLSRISYIGYLSHLRRVNIPIDRSIKITGPHRLHSQQWGMMCPFESPDGGSIGYLKNLSLLAKITAGLNNENIIRCLIDIGIIPLEKYNLCINKNITTVFLNGSLFGITGDPIFVTRILKAYRRNGLINILISISWNIKTNELRIFTEAGRPCRPLLILKFNNKNGNNEILVNKNNYTNWFDMLNGLSIKLKDEEKTDDYYYRDIYIDPLSIDIKKHKYIKSSSKGGGDNSKKEIFMEGGTDYDNKYFDAVYDGGNIDKNKEKQYFNGIFNLIKNNLYGGKIDDDDSDEDENIDNINYYRNKYSKILSILENNSACVEYLDNEETDTALIAMNKDEITPYHTHLEIHPSTILSVVTGNIPMCNHNQSVRNVFHAAQSKQAISIYATNFNNRFDTMSYVLHYPQRAIINTRIAQYTSSDIMGNGFNTIVAIMTYSGFNQEDSIMINKATINRGLNTLSYYKSITATSKIISQNERTIFGNPIKMMEEGINVQGIKKRDYSHINSDGFIKEGTYIPQGQEVIIIGMLNIKEVYKEVKKGVFIEQVKEVIYTDVSISTDNSLYGTVDKIYISNKLAGEDSIICKVRFLKIKKPEYGDKHASRHGQKGVLGMIIPEENMPFTKDGVRPDIIINPHAIPSRMTIGHLVECIFAKMCCLDGILGDATVFIPIDNEKIYKRLEDNGFNKYGNEILYNGFSGKQIETEIFIGPTYYFRLKHMVAEKLNARGIGKLAGLTRQPTEGRRKGGGLRIGEMERDTVLSHGLSLFLKESMMERSDKYTWSACKRCGTMIAFNITHNLNTCKNCNNDDVCVIQTPYAFKLFTQELEAMGIQMRINTEYIQLPVEQLYIDNNDDSEDSDEYNDSSLDNIMLFDDNDDEFIKDEKLWTEVYDFKDDEITMKGGYYSEDNIGNDVEQGMEENSDEGVEQGMKENNGEKIDQEVEENNGEEVDQKVEENNGEGVEQGMEKNSGGNNYDYFENDINENDINDNDINDNDINDNDINENDSDEYDIDEDDNGEYDSDDDDNSEYDSDDDDNGNYVSEGGNSYGVDGMFNKDKKNDAIKIIKIV